MLSSSVSRGWCSLLWSSFSVVSILVVCLNSHSDFPNGVNNGYRKVSMCKSSPLSCLLSRGCSCTVQSLTVVCMFIYNFWYFPKGIIFIGDFFFFSLDSSGARSRVSRSKPARELVLTLNRGCSWRRSISLQHSLLLSCI